MNTENIASYLQELESTIVVEEGGEWTTVQVPVAAWKGVAHKLFSEQQLNFLFCVTGVDWKTHLSMVYHLRSTISDTTLVVKVQLNYEKPEIETVSDIWRTAEFHEREVYEMFGVTFIGHPDLRKLILPDDFEGFPMRKNFEDPVNMIKL
ncbi:MAG: NADH-quinone oxidoreductase subunit C [Sediminibacterium sp.]|nr:NADH-quinone oxidoreductase subunit C [Sediminibacterium sp.]